MLLGPCDSLLGRLGFDRNHWTPCLGLPLADGSPGLNEFTEQGVHAPIACKVAVIPYPGPPQDGIISPSQQPQDNPIHPLAAPEKQIAILAPAQEVHEHVGVYFLKCAREVVH